MRIVYEVLHVNERLDNYLVASRMCVLFRTLDSAILQQTDGDVSLHSRGQVNLNF